GANDVQESGGAAGAVAPGAGPRMREAHVRTRSGTVVPVLQSCALMPEPPGCRGFITVNVLKDLRVLRTAQQHLADETHRFEILFNSISDAVFLAPLDADGVHGNFVQVNDVACGRLGYRRDELLQMNARTLNPAANLAHTRSVGQRIRRERQTVFEAIHMAKDGTQIPVEVVAKLVRIEGEDYVLSVVRDLRERKQLEQAESRFGRLMDHSWDEIYVFDEASLGLLQANQGALSNLGYSSAELLELKMTQIWPRFTDDRFRKLVAPLLEGRRNRLIFESVHCRKDGSNYPVEVRLQLSHSEVPPVFLANVQDITERKKTERRLTHLATHDPLTGLPNRARFLDRLEMALANAKRNETLAAVIFLDLDGFKSINDTMGHSVGDRLIQEVGRRLRNTVRQSDTVARLGGDEFTVIGTNLRSVGSVEQLAAKIIRSIARPLDIDGATVRTTPSLGITLFPFHDEDDIYALVRQADTAMYEAKKRGRNSYAFYTAALAGRQMRLMLLDSAAKIALAENQLQVHFQPRLALTDGSVVGAEALLRWNSPEFGAVAPDEFIPLMEQNGTIQEVGASVLWEACRQLRQWQEAGIDIAVSVNISARQFDDHTLPELVGEALRANDIAPHRLEIEITEGVLISQTDVVMGSLRALRDMGVRIALDDFGTGYSSLSYLKRFPIDRLKIDRDFIRDCDRNQDSALIVEAIVGLARSLKLKVTAEGVERDEQARMLGRLGCDEGQGYLYCRPKPAAELTEWLGSLLSVRRREP
ncbi:MAG TPA: EAL domain-containing protein, partial [Gammaproteobacteria bacterium]|nr:EAL domain-containing protein [Gammaproteobacteria bacterium]